MFNTRLWALEGAIMAFVLIASLVVQGNTEIFDNVYGDLVEKLHSAGADTFFEIITYLGNWQAITIICILLLAFDKTRKVYGIPVSIVAAGSYAINTALKMWIGRPRPEIENMMVDASGYSFPSGHAAVSMAVMTMIAYLIYKHVPNKVKRISSMIGLIAVAVVIGISRIYLGVHFASDVLGGWCLGWACFALVSLIFYPHKKEKEKKKAEIKEKAAKEIATYEVIEAELVDEEEK